MSDTAPSPSRTAPMALWRAAEAVLLALHALFGAPEDVARQHTLVAAAHARLAGWIRCAEAMLRRLIAIEAAAYARPNTRPLLTTKRPRVRKLMGFEADKPEKWRVSFRILDRRRPRRQVVEHRRDLCRRDAGGPSNRFRSAWPLAERYEALLRVFNDPTQYARRLSRRLHATPHRLREALRTPAEAGHRVEQFEAMGEAALAAWRMHFSSA